MRRRILGIVLVLIPLLGAPILAHAHTPEQLAYSLGWDKGVVIVRYGNQYGTGWWVAPGYIVTAAHVVDERVGAVATIYKGEWRAKGTVIAVLDSKHGDIAIVEVEGHEMPPDAHVWELVPLTGNTTAALKGGPLYVLGFPYELVMLYSYDLSKASMNPRVARGTFAWYDPSRELIEFNAITDAGNSGGPVVAEDGRVVGAVSYAIAGEAGVMYFATSSNKIIELCRQAGVPVKVSMRFSEGESWEFGSTGSEAPSQLVLGAAAGAAAALALALLVGGGRRWR